MTPPPTTPKRIEIYKESEEGVSLGKEEFGECPRCGWLHFFDEECGGAIDRLSTIEEEKHDR